MADLSYDFVFCEAVMRGGSRYGAAIREELVMTASTANYQFSASDIRPHKIVSAEISLVRKKRLSFGVYSLFPTL